MGAVNLVGAIVKYLSLAFLLPLAVALGYREPFWPFLAAKRGHKGQNVRPLAAVDRTAYGSSVSDPTRRQGGRGDETGRPRRR